jgi:hypothetical protein
MRPSHHHPASKLDPAVPEGDNRFAGHADPGLSGKTEMEHTSGQPDTWPQRPDVAVAESNTDGMAPTTVPAPLE